MILSNNLRAKTKELELRNVFAKNTDEFCKNTTLHGFKYVTSAELSGGEKFFFALSILIVLIGSCFFIYKVYDKWSTSPVIFGINPEPTFVVNEPFPAVTICNLNQAMKSEAQKYSRNTTEHAMIQLLCKQRVNQGIANSIRNWNALESLIINISQPCENLLVSCRFAAVDYNCSDLFQPIITDEGLCCVFNMLHAKFMFITHIPLTQRKLKPKFFQPVDWNAERGYPDILPEKFYPRKTHGTGESRGLSIVLDVQYDDYYCSSSNGAGVKVSIHSPNEVPNVRETGVLIDTGKESKLRVHPEKIESAANLRAINRHYRHCLFHDEGELKYFAHYTQRNCEIECMAQMLLNYCGCVSFYMPKLFENVTICSIYDQSCVNRVRLRLDPSIGSCLDSCLPSCFDLSFWTELYTLSISHDHFTIPNERVALYEKAYMKRSVVVINMFFREYSFRSHLQTVYIGVSDFLASVGGLLGLFLGFSFISIVEVFYFGIIRPCHAYFAQAKPQVVVKPLPEHNPTKTISAQIWTKEYSTTPAISMRQKLHKKQEFESGKKSWESKSQHRSYLSYEAEHLFHIQK